MYSNILKVREECKNLHIYILICFLFSISSCQSTVETNTSSASSLIPLQEVNQHYSPSAASERLLADEEINNNVGVGNGIGSELEGDLDSGLDGALNSKNSNNKKQQIQKKISINIRAKNESAKNFFLGLMASTNKNIVVHPDIDGTLSLNLKEVNLETILNITRDLYGYDYALEGEIYRIFPRRLNSKVFKINYPDIKRAGVSDTSISVSKIENTSDDNNNQSNSGDNGLLGTLLDTGSNGNISTTTGARVQTLTKSDFWSGLRDSISSMINVDEGGRGEKRVFVSPHSGIIIVKAYSEELRLVRSFLEDTQLIAQRQVLLEAKILEVQLSKGFESGIDWTAINGQAYLLKNISALSPLPNPSNITFTESAGEIFTSLVGVNDLQKLLNLLSTQGEVQVLSSPRISTVNNQKAVIKVGSDEFFVTGISNTTTSTASAVSATPDIELTSFFSGIALDVTPQISGDDAVILHIHPVVTEVTDQQKNFIVGDDEFSLPLALRDIRESDSIVRAHSGQVIVLGGLMKDFSRKQAQDRSWLSSIPIFGDLFFSLKNDASLKNELVILLKPQIIEADTWEKSLADSRKSVQDIERHFQR